MPIAADLPDDIDALKQLVVARTVERDAFRIERDAAVAERDAAKAGLVNKTLEAEKLKFQLARLKRMTFGASSERIKREIEQLELKLEELESDEAQSEPTVAPEPPAEEPSAEPREKKRRRQLPEHLPRTTATHEPASPACASCGSDRLRKVGEDVTEVLEYIPGRFEVIRHVRPAYSCRTCEAMAQAPMPSLPIPRGQAGPGLLAHVAIAKYCDHIPLYRQAEI
jgi:transposase